MNPFYVFAAAAESLRYDQTAEYKHKFEWKAPLIIRRVSEDDDDDD